MAKIPTSIWVVVITPIVAISGGEIQRVISTSAYPEINIERIRALEGTWEGYGIQPVTDKDSIRRLKDKGVQIGDHTNAKIKKLLALYNDCAFKEIRDANDSTIWFSAHLTLEVVRTSFLSRKSLRGTLEITPTTAKLSHLSNIYSVSGRLEQGGDYIRLDYVNTDGGKKDFGTLLLENTGDSKLCGQFMSYGPVSNSIVNGKYIFTDKSK